MKTETYSDSTRFGGIIDVEDFNTTKPYAKRLDNQQSANKEPESCLVARERRLLEKGYKNFTLEELREMKLVSNTNGRPTSYLTDDKWQKELNIRKLFIHPHPVNIKKMKGTYFKESGMWNNETQGTYHGATTWQTYCSFINDTLSEIQRGQVAYCYYIYQIEELLKFHFDTLETKYCDGYWEVWLRKEK